MQETEAGGPYAMDIRDDAGNETVIKDILVGDVWICAGQSNMELPMERVKDRYPKEIADCTNPAIRTFKITEHADFHAPPCGSSDGGNGSRRNLIRSFGFLRRRTFLRCRCIS